MIVEEEYAYEFNVHSLKLSFSAATALAMKNPMNCTTDYFMAMWQPHWLVGDYWVFSGHRLEAINGVTNQQGTKTPTFVRKERGRKFVLSTKCLNAQDWIVSEFNKINGPSPSSYTDALVALCQGRCRAIRKKVNPEYAVYLHDVKGLYVRMADRRVGVFQPTADEFKDYWELVN